MPCFSHGLPRWLPGLAALVGYPSGRRDTAARPTAGHFNCRIAARKPLWAIRISPRLGSHVAGAAPGLVVSDEPANYTYRQLVVDLAAAARLPAISWDRTYVEIGGLMAYGSSAADVMRYAAGYIVRILAGTKPGDLPIYLQCKYELLINLKVAMSLGLTIPTSLLVRADDVIE